MRNSVFTAAIIVTLWWSSMGANLQKGLSLQEFDQRISSRAFEDTILAALKCLREKLSGGVPELNIPPLDPLEIQEHTIDLNALDIPGLKGHVNISDLLFAETTNWEVTKLKGSIGIIPPRYTVSMTLNFPLIVFKSKYNIDAEYSEHKVYGEGSVSFEMVNFSVDIDARIKVLGGIAFDYIHIIPHLEALKSFEITGLMNNEELSAIISDVITANASRILDGLADDIDRVLGKIITESVNNGDHGAVSELLKQCL